MRSCKPRGRGRSATERSSSRPRKKSSASARAKKARMRFKRRDRKGRTMINANKLSRLCARLRDREWRRYGYLLVGGKLLGIALLLTAIYYISSITGASVSAGDAPP